MEYTMNSVENLNDVCDNMMDQGQPKHELTGRWSAYEHELFMQGINLHGKNWKKIAGMITGRTVVQIRTHAQKHFQKMDKHALLNGEMPLKLPPKEKINRSVRAESVNDIALMGNTGTHIVPAPLSKKIRSMTCSNLDSYAVGTVTMMLDEELEDDELSPTGMKRGIEAMSPSVNAFFSKSSPRSVSKAGNKQSPKSNGSRKKNDKTLGKLGRSYSYESSDFKGMARGTVNEVFNPFYDTSVAIPDYSPTSIYQMPNDGEYSYNLPILFPECQEDQPPLPESTAMAESENAADLTEIDVDFNEFNTQLCHDMWNNSAPTLQMSALKAPLRQFLPHNDLDCAIVEDKELTDLIANTCIHQNCASPVDAMASCHGHPIGHAGPALLFDEDIFSDGIMDLLY